MTSNKAESYYFETKDGVPKLWTSGFIAFVCLNIFIFLGFDVLLPTLTLYLESHGHSRDVIGRIFSFFMIAAIIMRMIAPRLVLLIKPFLLVRLGLCVGGLSVIGYFFAHSAPAASAVRFLHGLGFGVASTVLTALAAQIIPAHRMAQGMGFLGLGTILTLALGPSAGIWLKDNLGYLPMFVVVSGIYLTGLVWTFKMPDLALTPPPEGKRKPKLVLLSRLALAPSLLMFMIGISISSVAIYLALYFNEVGLAYSGWYFGLSTIGICFSRLFSGRIQDRFGHRFVITPAIILMSGAVMVIPRISGPLSLFVAALMWGLAAGSLFPSIQALSFSKIPAHGRTEVAASIFNAFDLGMGTGSVVFGLISEYFQTYKAAYWGNSVNLAFFLTFYLLYYFVISPKKSQSAPKTTKPAAT
ncbi:MAG: MFS transporter [Deltaproteobacteria bacterium]|jgi:MFS family permease|nr:MFS transporter [Deltaproteobacteria bacterium]